MTGDGEKHKSAGKLRRRLQRWQQQWRENVPAPLRKVFAAVVGTTVVLIGAVMLVTPGPGIVVILIGLALLGSEFVIFARVLRKMRERATSITDQVRGKREQPSPPAREDRQH
jgi:uncharacterized protein (TIGR02611 family)